MDNNALKGNSLQLQLHHLGVETESQTIDLVGSILHLLSYEAKAICFQYCCKSSGSYTKY